MPGQRWVFEGALDRLDHQELVAFIQRYIKKWNAYTGFYFLANALLNLLTAYLIFRGYGSPTYLFGDRFTHFSYGIPLAFALLPLQKYNHVLAYRSRGATTTSFSANLRKRYFMALTDKFVANERKFTVVALSPFVLISALLLSVVPLVHGMNTDRGHHFNGPYVNVPE